MRAFMYVCMYVCVYVCMNVRTYVCMYVGVYVCTKHTIFTRIHTNTDGEHYFEAVFSQSNKSNGESLDDGWNTIGLVSGKEDRWEDEWWRDGRRNHTWGTHVYVYVCVCVCMCIYKVRICVYVYMCICQCVFLEDRVVA
jgi:hypothetical protein